MNFMKSSWKTTSGETKGLRSVTFFWVDCFWCGRFVRKMIKPMCCYVSNRFAWIQTSLFIPYIRPTKSFNRCVLHCFLTGTAAHSCFIVNYEKWLNAEIQKTKASAGPTPLPKKQVEFPTSQVWGWLKAVLPLTVKAEGIVKHQRKTVFHTTLEVVELIEKKRILLWKALSIQP